MRAQVLTVVPPCLSGFGVRNSVDKVVRFTEIVATFYAKQYGQCRY